MPKTAFTLLFLLIVSIFAGSSAAAAQERPPVLAFYYAWFDDGTWTSGRPTDTPSPTYRSADPGAIERQVVQAQSAGINGFVQSWYGPQVENNQTETNFRMLLDIAAAHQFQAAVDVEVSGPLFPNRDSVQSGLATLMATHIHHPAYFRYRGKPVIFFWRQQRFSPADWAQIRAAVDPDHNTYWIAEGTDLSYQDVFDGHHLYSIAWAGDPQAELNKWPPRLRSIEERSGVDKLWVATAMPGYNDLNLGRANGFSRARQQGDYYRQTWAAAQATNPDMIIITSFNEWLEGSQIEPSVTYGDFYLNLTRNLIAGAGAAPPPPPPTPTEPETITTIAQPTAPPPPTEAATPAPIETRSAVESETGLVYTIQSGDTLSAVARSFGLTVEAIATYNRIDPQAILRVGQKLSIPVEAESRESTTNEAQPTPTADPPLPPNSRNIPEGYDYRIS